MVQLLITALLGWEDHVGKVSWLYEWYQSCPPLSESLESLLVKKENFNTAN